MTGDNFFTKKILKLALFKPNLIKINIFKVQEAQNGLQKFQTVVIYLFWTKIVN